MWPLSPENTYRNWQNSAYSISIINGDETWVKYYNCEKNHSPKNWGSVCKPCHKGNDGDSFLELKRGTPGRVYRIVCHNQLWGLLCKLKKKYEKQFKTSDGKLSSAVYCSSMTMPDTIHWTQELYLLFESTSLNYNVKQCNWQNQGQ